MPGKSVRKNRIIKRKSGVGLLVVLLFSTSAAFGATIRVPLNQPTIQAGINAASDRDTVLVAPGTYVENINFNGKAIRVMSESGPTATVINGNQAGSVVTFENAENENTLLTGFSITNGRAERGGGIHRFDPVRNPPEFHPDTLGLQERIQHSLLGMGWLVFSGIIFFMAGYLLFLRRPV